MAYFVIMWFGTFALGMRLRLPYESNAAVAFTAAGNNFELAIAVAIGVFGVSSGQSLAGVVGPLIEVPVLVGLVYVALWAKRRYYAGNSPTTAPRSTADDDHDASLQGHPDDVVRRARPLDAGHGGP